MNDAPFTVLLGVAQDAGHPQVGCYKPCCKPAWEDPTLGHLACSLAIVDPVSSERWIIDVSPDFPEQLHMLDTLQPPRGTAPDLAGVVLTHAHIGHFAGLMYLGREVMGDLMFQTYIDFKRAEWESYHNHVSDWEVQQYLKLW